MFYSKHVDNRIDTYQLKYLTSAETHCTIWLGTL